jgi:Flp pilus assembly protein TadD
VEYDWHYACAPLQPLTSQLCFKGGKAMNIKIPSILFLNIFLSLALCMTGSAQDTRKSNLKNFRKKGIEITRQEAKKLSANPIPLCIEENSLMVLGKGTKYNSDMLGGMTLTLNDEAFSLSSPTSLLFTVNDLICNICEDPISLKGIALNLGDCILVKDKGLEKKDKLIWFENVKSTNTIKDIKAEPHWKEKKDIKWNGKISLAHPITFTYKTRNGKHFCDGWEGGPVTDGVATASGSLISENDETLILFENRPLKLKKGNRIYFEFILEKWKVLIYPDYYKGAEVKIFEAQYGNMRAPQQKERKATVKVSEEARRLNTEAKQYHDSGQYDKSIELLTKAVQLCPQYADAYNNLSAAHAAKGQGDLALSFSMKAIAMNSDKGAYYTTEGIAYYKLGNLDQSITAFNKAIALGETAAEMRSVLGNAYFKKGMLDEAIEQYKLALTINPNLRGARNNLKAAEEEKARKR